MGKTYYAVRKGRAPGIYLSLAQCKEQVDGYADAEYKRFKLKSLAQCYLDEETTSDVDNAVYQLEYDGASKGNPGKAGAGALLRQADGSVVQELTMGLGEATCNCAEYHGLILGLRAAIQRNVRYIQVQGDSTLVCKQVSGKWAVRDEKLVPLHAEVCSLRKEFRRFSIRHVPREYNLAADTLANRGVHLKCSEISETMMQPPNEDAGIKAMSSKEEAKVETKMLLEYAGFCRGNRGMAGAGALLRFPDGSVVDELWTGLGVVTSNAADYHALILGLEAAAQRKVSCIEIVGTSALVCKQVEGTWAARSENILPLYEKVKALAEQFSEFNVRHVSKESNTAAESLAARGMERNVDSGLNSGPEPAAQNIVPDSEMLPNNLVYQLEYDGASKGNPGRAGAGAVLRDPDGSIIEELIMGLGFTTNNVAEYEGLILGLKAAIRRNITSIQILGDSTLVCKQVNGEWAVKNQTLARLHSKVQDLSKQFVRFAMYYVQRELNAAADSLANKATRLREGETKIKLGKKTKTKAGEICEPGDAAGPENVAKRARKANAAKLPTGITSPLATKRVGSSRGAATTRIGSLRSYSQLYSFKVTVQERPFFMLRSLAPRYKGLMAKAIMTAAIVALLV